MIDKKLCVMHRIGLIGNRLAQCVEAKAVGECSVLEHGVDGMQQPMHDGTDSLEFIEAAFLNELGSRPRL